VRNERPKRGQSSLSSERGSTDGQGAVELLWIAMKRKKSSS